MSKTPEIKEAPENKLILQKHDVMRAVEFYLNEKIFKFPVVVTDIQSTGQYQSWIEAFEIKCDIEPDQVVPIKEIDAP